MQFFERPNIAADGVEKSPICTDSSRRLSTGALDSPISRARVSRELSSAFPVRVIRQNFDVCGRHAAYTFGESKSPGVSGKIDAVCISAPTPNTTQSNTGKPFSEGTFSRAAFDASSAAVIGHSSPLSLNTLSFGIFSGSINSSRAHR